MTNKIPVSFTRSAKEAILSWLMQYAKNTEAVELWPDAWLDEIYNAVADRNPHNKPEYELSARESNSGRPVLLGLNDDDFIWADDN
jgi:hypothetical protein